MNKTQIGRLGEDLVCDYLISNGMSIMARNYYSRMGEIDIIAEKGDMLYFIEVKLRKNSKYGNPYEAVNRGKQTKIIKTALQYIANYNKSNFMSRFDIAEVIDSDDGLKVNYIENAFDYSGKYGY